MRQIVALLALTVAACAQTTTPIKLTPGVATTLKRTSASEYFSTSAIAGQTLLVELNIEDPNDDGDTIKVFAPKEPKPLKSTLDDHIQDHWMAVLQQSGTYRVTVARKSTKPYVLRLTLLDPHDPRLDVGIRPEQISILDLHKEIAWEFEGFSPVAPALGEFAPAFIDSSGGRLHVTVRSVEGVKRTFWVKDRGAKAIAQLEANLKAGVVSISPQDTPGNLNAHADVTFVARKQGIKGPSIRAIRWLCMYDQMDTAPVNPISYAAEGITADGRFLITAEAAVGHPVLPTKPLDLVGDQLRDFRTRLARKLEAVSPDSFEPSLAHYDAMVQSIVIR